MSSDLYRQQIIELWRNPMNFGETKGADARSEGSNPLCGDELEFYILLEPRPKGKAGSARIAKASFTGEGCAISKASASLLTEELVGKTPEEAMEISPERIIELLGVEISAARIKCAMLSLVTAKQACLGLVRKGKAYSPNGI